MNQIPPFSHMLHSGLLTNRKIVFSPVFFSRLKNLAYVYSDVENAKRVVFNFSRVKTRGGRTRKMCFSRIWPQFSQTSLSHSAKSVKFWRCDVTRCLFKKGPKALFNNSDGSWTKKKASRGVLSTLDHEKNTCPFNWNSSRP